MPAATVLIFTRETLGGSLIGVLAESAGHLPAFPLAGEEPEIAIRRLKPEVVILEGNHSAARNKRFWDTIDELSVPVIIFAPSEPWGHVAALKGRINVTAFIEYVPGASLATGVAKALSGIAGSADWEVGAS
jgi:hypothetical protein